MTQTTLPVTAALILVSLASCQRVLIAAEATDRPRIIATTDGEIDNRCSTVR